MSANLDLVRSIFKTWEDGDIERFLREHFEPTARLDLSEAIFNPAVYEGYEEIARQRREINDVWEVFEIEVERLFEGEDAVVAFTREHGRGEASGVEVDRDAAFLIRLREGKVSDVRAYRDRDRALADLGLEEQAASQRNVQIVRDRWEHFVATGEPPWQMTDENVVVYDHDIMDGEVYRGYAGVSRWLNDWATAWSAFTMDAEEFLDADPSVVVIFRLKATGAKSGAEVTRQDALVFRMCDARAVRIDYYNSRDQALKAVGRG